MHPTTQNAPITQLGCICIKIRDLFHKSTDLTVLFLFCVAFCVAYVVYYYTNLLSMYKVHWFNMQTHAYLVFKSSWTAIICTLTTINTF